ncbi:hypothetical protein Zmor_003020 [Zophobas morio]|uniref:Uncharacterized protein n=1 Tax=Zophobas morio TaxID=2755281 RepID=A0AA38HLK3_9CUCU|nr:hypothetical protein Zmor_003020 [Zophobas morio]
MGSPSRQREWRLRWGAAVLGRQLTLQQGNAAAKNNGFGFVRSTEKKNGDGSTIFRLTVLTGALHSSQTPTFLENGHGTWTAFPNASRLQVKVLFFGRGGGGFTPGSRYASRTISRHFRNITPISNLTTPTENFV